jgi:glutaredoxin
LQSIVGEKRLAERPELIVYTLEYCPNCETLKEYLTRNAIPYKERDMSGAAALTELRINGIFVSEAPVLQAGAVFLVSRDLFSAGILDEDRVLNLSEGS